MIDDVRTWWHERVRSHRTFRKMIPGSQGYYFVDCSCGRSWIS